LQEQFRPGRTALFITYQTCELLSAGPAKMLDSAFLMGFRFSFPSFSLFPMDSPAIPDFFDLKP
jgi:hypothetical protein